MRVKARKAPRRVRRVLMMGKACKRVSMMSKANKVRNLADSQKI